MEVSRKFIVARVEPICVEVSLCQTALLFFLSLSINLFLFILPFVMTRRWALHVKVPVPAMLAGGEEKNIVEAGVSRVGIIKRLESVGVGPLVKDDIT